MQPHDSAPSRAVKVPQSGFIAAEPLSGGDVIGIFRDERGVAICWVNDPEGDMPLSFHPSDLPVIAKMISNAAARLHEGGE